MDRPGRRDSDVGGKPPQRRRPEQSRGEPEAASSERILDAATELFARQGFVGTTIREIAARAAANSALIYYYFGSKDGLLEALVARIQKVVAGNLDRSVATRPGGGPAETLESFIRLQAGLMRRQAPLFRILLREVMNRNELVLGAVRRAIEANLTRVRDLIAAGVAAGELRVPDADLAARMLVGAIMIPIVLAPLILGDEPESDGVEERIVEILMSGLRAR